MTLDIDDTVEYGMAFLLEGDSLTPYLPRIAETTGRALYPGARYELRANNDILGGYYAEEHDHTFLSPLKRCLAVFLPLRWRRKWLYTYVKTSRGWVVCWYSLPKTFARETEWSDYLHTAIPPDTNDFCPMTGCWRIGRQTVPESTRDEEG
jgi:hypothetical protein